MARKNKKKTTTFNPPTIQRHSKIHLALHGLFICLGLIGETILIPCKYVLKWHYAIFSKDSYRRIITVAKFFIFAIQQKGKNSKENLKNLLRILHWQRHSLKKELLLQSHSLPKTKTLYVAQPKKFSIHLPQIYRNRKNNRISYTMKKRSIKPNIPWFSRLLYITLGGAVVFFIGVIPLSFYTILKTLPNPRLLSNREIPVTTKIFDRHGILLYEIFTDENRTPLPLSEIPENIKQATISIEDKNFYLHAGFSIQGILRALREILFHQQVQGGSTITQQLIKSTLLTPEIKISRKVKEIFLAFWAEQLYTKNEILEMYLNQVPYGGTAWGIESASQTYFGKSVRDLSLAEAAFLAGLPAAPSNYSPYNGGEKKATERQHEVLRRMAEDNYISPEQVKQAQEEKLKFRAPVVSIKAPHFVWYVKDYLTRRYGERLVERGGLQITTTLDSELQSRVQAIVSSHVNALQPLQVGNGAALVTNPKTGEILAMVGSKEYFATDQDGNVNVTTSLRQPGSSIKVTTYATALEQKKITAATLLDDSPITYPIAGQPSYSPVNYDGRFHGLTPLRMALANSYNIPAVKLLNSVGIDSMIDTAKRMGIDTWNDRSRFGLSLTLGGGEVTMLDMAEVYGTLANLGKRVDVTPILEVTDYLGRNIEKESTSKSLQAISPESAWIISNILSDNAARVPAFGPVSQLVIPGKTVSVKTGTTNEKRDNWTIGYTPSYVTTVWVGNNDNTPMNPYLTSGVTGAAPIWHDIMIELLKEKQDEVSPKPETIVTIPCYFGKIEYFIKDTEPKDGRCGTIPTLTPSRKPL